MGVAKGLLALQQGVRVGARNVFRIGQVLQWHQVALQPLPVGLRLHILALELLVLDNAALTGVNQEDAAGAQTLLELDIFRRHIQHPHLGGHDHHVVMGDIVAGRAQAVAIQHRADDLAVCERNGRRAVPGFHQTGVILIERLALRGHGFMAAPGLGDHHQYGVRQGAAGDVQKLHDIVKHGGVAAALDDDGKNFPQVGAKQPGFAQSFPRAHPVGVAAHGVDLAVVAQIAIWVRQAPRREGVGGKPLMHQGQGALHLRVGEVREHGFKLGAGQHALIDEGAPGQRGNVKQLALRQVGTPDRVFHPLADHIELAFEGGGVRHLGAAPYEDLPEGGFARHRRGAQQGIIGRHIAPAQQGLPFLSADARKGLLALRRLGLVPGQEH